MGKQKSIGVTIILVPISGITRNLLGKFGLYLEARRGRLTSRISDEGYLLVPRSDLYYWPQAGHDRQKSSTSSL